MSHLNSQALVTSSVSSFLNPKSIALVGASERSRWSISANQNLNNGYYKGRIHLINARGSLINGVPTAKRCEDLNTGIDLALLMVPGEHVLSSLEDAAKAGASYAVILTAGFAETGLEGQKAQVRIAETAKNLGIRLLGPNCLGYMNFVNRTHVWTTTITEPSKSEGVAIVSQSGATALFLSHCAQKQGIGLSYVISTGNEIDFEITEFVNYLVDDPSTKAIALFVEAFRQPQQFLQVAKRAMQVGKPIIVLKAGAGVVSAKSAIAHTGSLVGDDRVFEGVTQQFGIIRTFSMDELLATAHFISQTGLLAEGSLCVISNSGGICEIAADSSERCAHELPDFSDSLKAKLVLTLPSAATAQNPLDLTGAVTPEQCTNIIKCIGQDKDYSAILTAWYEVPNEESEASERLIQTYDHLSEGAKNLKTPLLMTSYTPIHVNAFAQSILDDKHFKYLPCGLDRAIQAATHAIWWSKQYRIHGNRGQTVSLEIPSSINNSNFPKSEWEALNYLRSKGVATVPMQLVKSEDEAVSFFKKLGVHVAMKIASPDIPHKTEVGGVYLNVETEEQIRTNYKEMIQRVTKLCPNALIEGVLIAPMRGQGVELLVSMTRDPQWGPVLVVGLGGVWVEVLKDVSMRLLPVTPDDVLDMLSQLKAQILLKGYRGKSSADFKTLAAFISHIGDVILELGPELQTMEINPLWVNADQVEALDALCEWSDSVNFK